MTDIVAFLNGRLDEDEAAAEADLDKAALAVYNSATAHPRRKACEDFTTLPSPVQERYRALAAESLPTLARVLREVKAKRAILAEHEQVVVDKIQIPDPEPACVLILGCTVCNADCQCYPVVNGCGPEACDTVRIMAAVYADHPDYDPTWSVDA